MKNVLYVPLDDRPVNLDDVVRQGCSAGLNLITPSSADLRNGLDTVAITSGSEILGTRKPIYGNTANLRQFILDRAASVDGFIISTDMLAYGGLIGSRRLRECDSGDYPDYDRSVTRLLDVIRRIKQPYPSKPVYVLDTIMRLATTTYVEGLTYDAYVESRELMGRPRRSCTRFDDILSDYNISDTGEPYGSTTHFDKEAYYNTRRHKFKTNHYILDQLTRPGYIDFLAIGVDDANTQGVQINEIRFVEQFIDHALDGRGGQNPDRAVILPDADGLGHSLVARMANQLYRNGRKQRFSIQYYGPDGSTIINPYEYMSVHDNLLRHIDMVGGRHVTEAPDIEIIAITGADEASNAVHRIQTNGDNSQATLAIDFVGQGAANAAVTDALLEQPVTGRLLGYSGWNTAGNKIGIALGMAQARYAFLVTETQKSALEKALQAHGSLLFKRFLKDYYYKAVTIAEIRAYSRSHAQYSNIPQNFADQHMLLFNSPEDYSHLLTMLREQMQAHTPALASRKAFVGADSTSAAANVKQIHGSTWNLAAYTGADLELNDPNFKWGRAFEITLQPSVMF